MIFFLLIKMTEQEEKRRLLIKMTEQEENRREQEENRRNKLQDYNIINEVKEFYNRTFKDNQEAYNDAKANLNEKKCFSPNCNCIRSRVTKYKRVKKNNESIRTVVNVEPPKLYVFCHACASVLCPGPSWRS